MNDINPCTGPATRYSDSETVRIARRVTWTGFWVNAALGGLKIGAGIVGRSSAMVADGIHSLSDFITDLIVIVLIGVSRRKANSNYQYGYGKYETFATMIIAMALAVVAVIIFYESARNVTLTLRGDVLPRPGMIALVMAIVSIAAKELLFHYTIRWGRRIGSDAVVANGWHHRSDAFSSIATLAGIVGAMFLGEKWRILDPVAAMLVSVFILIVAIRIGLPSVRELLEVSLPPELTKRILDVTRSTPGVITFHRFRSRRNGSRLILDLHIKVDPGISVEEGHDIADNVEQRIKNATGQRMIINIHVEPYRGQQIKADGSCQ